MIATINTANINSPVLMSQYTHSRSSASGVERERGARDPSGFVAGIGLAP
jgi:hypothetical protein